MNKKKTGTNKGITLIALVITVIVLLILAGTAISIAVNGGNIFAKANTAVESYNAKAAQQETAITTLNTQFDEYYTGYKPAPTEIKMTLGAAPGTEVTLTKNNFAEHLGKIVTNYTGAPTSVTNDKGTYNVSNTYRLYWIDWENKYRDGAGTIYLKADCTSEKYSLGYEEPEETIDPENSIIRKLNPELYKNGNTPPDVECYSMCRVRWLLTPSNWKNLKISRYSEKTNYVVGAPSLEMMMDSYNAHYASVLIGTTSPYTSSLTAGERTKLWYKFTSEEYGYQVGPCGDFGLEYEGFTSEDSVYTDSAIDSLYCAGEDDRYWIASPGTSRNCIYIYVSTTIDGSRPANMSYVNSALCPVVSLQPDVQL